ncbi:hypothetical protein PQX77_001599 [Marasmius sp. AFHP31]|nr:hypothetical protein PQX77_001599 [Marasmius sp. AFHP31]
MNADTRVSARLLLTAVKSLYPRLPSCQPVVGVTLHLRPQGDTPPLQFKPPRWCAFDGCKEEEVKVEEGHAFVNGKKQSHLYCAQTAHSQRNASRTTNETVFRLATLRCVLERSYKKRDTFPKDYNLAAQRAERLLDGRFGWIPNGRKRNPQELRFKA